jgi:hypothetical protein
MDYLFELEKTVEVIEDRVPLGRPGMRVLLSGVLLYALFYVFRALMMDLFWPITHFVIQTIGELYSGRFVLPKFSTATIIGLLFVAFGIVATVLGVQRLQAAIYSRVRSLEVAIERYQSIFWKPLEFTEKHELIKTLSGLGPHRVLVTAVAATDCIELARDLRDCFEVAHWQVVKYDLAIGGVFRHPLVASSHGSRKEPTVIRLIA